MHFSHFSLRLAARFLLLLLLLVLLAFLLNQPGLLATKLLLGVATLGALVYLWKLINRTNRDLANFFHAASSSDSTEVFSQSHAGSGFDELGALFNGILEKLRNQSSQKELEARRLNALIEHAPVPLVSIDNKQQVRLQNSAARRLFNSQTTTSLHAMQRFGRQFVRQLETIRAGEQRLVVFHDGEQRQHFAVTATELAVGASKERLIALQNIQNELDATEIRAWQELVQVLTHEIMNSITPIVSLAETSRDVMAGAIKNLQQTGGPPSELTDAVEAVNALGGRAENLLHFVGNFRRLTHLPALKLETVRLASLFDQLAKLTCASWPDRNIQLQVRIEPDDLSVNADRALLEQALINLLNNAAQALEQGGADKGAPGQVWLTAKRNQQGQVVVRIMDNGRGIDAAIAEQIFVPFFTTKKKGSGIGLALTRQIMIAHHGAIDFCNGEQGGACFTLTF